MSKSTLVQTYNFHVLALHSLPVNTPSGYDIVYESLATCGTFGSPSGYAHCNHRCPETVSHELIAIASADTSLLNMLISPNRFDSFLDSHVAEMRKQHIRQAML